MLSMYGHLGDFCDANWHVDGCGLFTFLGYGWILGKRQIKVETLRFMGTLDENWWPVYRVGIVSLILSTTDGLEIQ